MRPKVKARYARGEETKARILKVAVSLFGGKGYDCVSTREIALAAEVPPASLRYYFVNKQGLYIACLNYLQISALQVIEPALQAAETLLQASQADVEQLIDAYCTLQQAHLDHMIGGPGEGAAALFMIRHDLPSEGGSSNLKGDGSIAQRMMVCFIQLMKAISGNTLDNQAALLVAGLINGQLTHIYLRRQRLAEIGWEITPERLAWLKQTVRKQTRAILQAHSGTDPLVANPKPEK